MKKLVIITIGFFLSYTLSFAEIFTAEISNITQTSANITVTGSDIQKKPGFNVLSVKLTGIGSDIILVEPDDVTCFANVCNFLTTPKNVPGLTCNTNYISNTQIVNSFNNLSKKIQFKTLACEAGIKITFDSIIVTSSEKSKALVKVRIQDSSLSATELDVKALFTPITANPLSPSPADSIPFSRSLGSISNASNEKTLETEIDIGCTQEITPKKYSVVIEATSRSTPPKVGRSEVIQFITDICPEESSVGNEGGRTPPTTTDNTYVFLTPLPVGKGLTPQGSVEIGAGGGGILGILQRIFTIMLVAAVVLAVVFMIIGGARYATGDTLGGKMGGRQIITNAVTGLLFALLAWLLLNIVNPDLLRFTLSIPNIGKSLTPGTGNGDTGGGTISGEGCGPDVSNEECFDIITADEARVRKIFTDAGFTFNADPCVSPDPDVSGCTNVGKLSPTTINALLTVKRECNCAIMITGGTEYWLHAGGGNHKAFTAVDLRIGQAPFDNFVKSKTKVGNPFSLCTETYSYAGLRFCNESGGAPHWHVDTVKSSSGNTGSGNTGDPKPGQLFTFPRINIQGYVVPGTGSVYTETQLAAKINAQDMKVLRTQITAAANSAGVDSKLFYALVAQESAGNPQAGSGAGACGVAQLLPGTARPLDPSLTGLSDSAVCTTLKNNVDLSLRVGAKYLKKGFQEGGGESKNALAYYNGGPQALETSGDCPGRKKYECPWDAPGYYDRTKPSGPPLKALEKQSDINTGFSETRFYVINILNMEAI